ncbi:hypothetical protein I0C86_16280 [Plantactinospora sp. S1510]|uniref:Lipoprotein n=1 Tax=Plantactinospora alkalitolerans TaxID=2789879 RepID=A0ABS0GWB9_9ACTN|nr:hypothetical protein [Plantactinospora alkalitolerans]
MHLGALTALALTLTGCNQVGDDDDCDSRSTKPKNRSLASADPASAGVVEARVGGGGGGVEPVAAVPTQSGFGTHLASCGG